LSSTVGHLDIYFIAAHNEPLDVQRHQWGRRIGTQEGASAVWDNMTKIGRHETIEGESMDRHRKARCFVA